MPDNESVTVNATPPPTVPTQPNPDLPQGLSAGLQPPQGITVPGTNMTDTVPPSQVTPQANPQHLVGKAFGKILSGLSGGHNEYEVDPNTGQTITTRVKDSPGQTFKSILALGLLGGQGIGPQHGEVTFAQGLMSGLGGGVKAGMERSDMLDKQRREQAQLQYANELKAAQEARENKKLTMEQQLNQVAIADHNQNIAYRGQLLKEQAYNFAKQQGVDVAGPLIQNSQMQVEADAPKVNGYKELGVDPLASGLTLEEVNKYVQDHPGATTSQMGFHTGTRQVLDPKTGQVKVQELYSVYPAMTKVPPSMLQQLKSDGADNPKSTLYSAYKELTASKDGNVDARKLLPIYRDMTSWEKLQGASLDRRLKESEIFAHYQTGAAEKARLRLEEMGIKDKEDQMASSKLFQNYFDVAHQKLVPNALTELVAGKADPLTGKTMTAQQALIRQNQLKQSVVANYQQTEHDFFDHYKPTKDAFGNYVSDDAQAGPMMSYMQGLRGAADQLSDPQGYAGKQQKLQGLTGIPRNVVSDILEKGVTDPVAIQNSIKNLPAGDQFAIFKALGIQPPAGVASETTKPYDPHDSLSPMGRGLVNAATDVKNTIVANPKLLIP